MLSRKWDLTDNVYYQSRQTLANAGIKCQSFVVPVPCCLHCKQPLVWHSERSMLRLSETIEVAGCCGTRYEWDSLTLIRPTEVVASSYEDAISKAIKQAV